MMSKTLFTYRLSFSLLVILCFHFTPSNAQSFTAMTYNIRLDTESDGENQWSKRKDFLMGQINFFEPTVFGVQEALPNQMDDLKETLSDYTAIGVGREDGKNKGEYSALFYQADVLKLLNSGTFWLSETPALVSTGWDAALPRICTWGLFQHCETNEKVLVMNTHFDHVGQLARENSIDLIIEKSKEINGNSDPLVVMGDFNLEPESVAIQKMSKNLADSRVVAADHAFGPEGTFNGWQFEKPVNRRIDYIFFSDQNLKLNKYAVLSDYVNNRYASDHLPVYVELEFLNNKL